MVEDQNTYFASVGIVADIYVAGNLNCVITARHDLLDHFLADDTSGILGLPTGCRGNRVPTGEGNVDGLYEFVAFGLARLTANQSAWMLASPFCSWTGLQTLDGIVEVFVMTSVDA